MKGMSQFISRLGTDRFFQSGMSLASKRLKDPNAHLTIAENLAFSIGHSPKMVMILNSSLRFMAKNPKSLEEPAMHGALLKILLSTVYKTTHLSNVGGNNQVYYFSRLEDNILPFLEDYFGHCRDVANLRTRMLDTKRSINFEFFDSRTSDCGLLSFQDVEEEVNSEANILSDISIEYVQHFKWLIASEIFRRLVMSYPHDSVGYNHNTSLFRKMLGKTFLSAEEANQTYILTVNQAWYGCEDEASVRNACIRLAKNDAKQVERRLLRISGDIAYYFANYGRCSLDRVRDTKDFVIFRS